VNEISTGLGEALLGHDQDEKSYGAVSKDRDHDIVFPKFGFSHIKWIIQQQATLYNAEKGMIDL